MKISFLNAEKKRKTKIGTEYITFLGSFMRFISLNQKLFFERIPINDYFRVFQSIGPKKISRLSSVNLEKFEMHESC